MNIFQFLSFRSDAARARTDVKRAKTVRRLESSMAYLKDTIDGCIKKRVIEGTYNNIMKFLKTIKTEDDILVNIDKDAEIQNYHLIQDINKVRNELEGVRPRDKTVDSLLKQLESVLKGIRQQVITARRDAKKVRKGKTSVRVKIAGAFRSETREAKMLMATARWIRKGVKTKDSELAQIKDLVKNINRSKPEDKERFMRELEKFTKEYIDVSEKEGKVLYQMETNFVLLQQGIEEEINFIEERLAKLEDERYGDKKKLEDMKKYASEVKQGLTESIRSIEKRERKLAKLAR